MPQLRKILSKKEQEEKDHKKRKMAGIVISLIMLFSTAAFAFLEGSGTTEKENEQKYKDYTFQKTESGWQTKINDQLITTTYLPQEVENITSPSFITNSFGNVIYFIADTFEEKRAAQEISNVISAQRIQLACLPEEADIESCKELPLKNCSDASMQTGIIIIKEKNETSIEYGNYCLAIYANSSEIIKAADKTIFKMLGII